MLWAKAEQVATKALAQGYLMPIIATGRLVEQDGVRFVLYTVTGTNAKAFKRPVKGQVNPFLPYQQNLLVAELTPDYVCLLNKFPVLFPHLLICSRIFVEQSELLTLADFSAWLHGFKQRAVPELSKVPAGQGLPGKPDILGFYNSGSTAGASQRHRHMQLAYTPVAMADKIITGQLGFKHYLIKYQQLSPQYLFNHYRQAIQRLGLTPVEGEKSKAYNILLTDSWMLVVPRCACGINGVYANGMNYAGVFLVKNEQQAQWLCEYGLLKFLKNCSQDQ